MIPYYLLIGIPFVAYFVCIIRGKNGGRKIVIGLGPENEEYNLSLPLFFIMLFFLVALRGVSVGNDTYNYMCFFERDGLLSLNKVFAHWEEGLFTLYNYTIYNVVDDFQIYLFITTIITVLPIMYFYCRDKQHSLLKISIFVNMSTFVMLFSGIRQGIAISLGVLAFDAIGKNKKIIFVILIIISFLLHTSGFMIIFMYPLYKARFKKMHLIFIVPLIVVCLIFNKQIFVLLEMLMSRVSDKFTADISPTGAFGTLILFILFTVFIFLIGDEAKMDNEAFALRNILLFAVILQCFAPLHTLAMRMNYYFIILIPAAIGKLLSTPKKSFVNVARWGEIIICIYFIFDFCLRIYTSYESGVSALNTVPYIPFWKETGGI